MTNHCSHYSGSLASSAGDGGKLFLGQIDAVLLAVEAGAIRTGRAADAHVASHAAVEPFLTALQPAAALVTCKSSL